MNTRLVVAVLFVVGAAVNTVTATTGFSKTPVFPLTTAVSNTNCGSTKFCGFLPSACSPATPGCYFASAKSGNTTFVIELSGNSLGYIAATVSPGNANGNNDTTYICANGNMTVDFYTALLNNITLVPANLTVTSVNGTNNGNVTQCTINAPATNASLVTIYNGTYNMSAGDLGNPTFLFQLNITRLLNGSTTPTPTPTSPNYGTALQQSLTQALLITAGVLGLTMM